MAGPIYALCPDRMVRPGRPAVEGQQDVNWNDFKKVLRAFDEHVTENTYEYGRRWVPERESVTATREIAVPKKPANAAPVR